MNKTEVRVTIDSTEKQQLAIQILEKYGEKIWESEKAMLFDEEWKHLIFSSAKNHWFIKIAHLGRKEIAFFKLEEILEKEKNK